MAKKSESERTRKLCAKLAAMGCMVYPLVGSREAPAGWPDRLIVSKLGMWLVEFKDRASGRLRPVQHAVIERLSKLQPVAFVVSLDHDGESGVVWHPCWDSLEYEWANGAAGMQQALLLAETELRSRQCSL